MAPVFIKIIIDQLDPAIYECAQYSMTCYVSNWKLSVIF